MNGFLWLNKLGATAAAGLSVVIRQTFYHGNYALIGEDLQPNPDFWVSVLYKKLVGRKVLKIKGHENTGNTLRLFAHCGKEIPRSRQDRQIVLFGLNMSNRTETVKFENDIFKVTEYVLSPGDGNISSRAIFMKMDDPPDFKKILKLEEGWRVPHLSGVKNGGPITELSIGPFEMGFWTYSPIESSETSDHVKTCMDP